MATKRTQAKRTTKKVDGVDYEIDNNTTVTFYDWGDRQTAKITLNNAFVIYASIKDGGRNKGYFLSYPAYKKNNGEYVNMAYCFDKALIEAINEAITDFMYGF